MTKTVLFDLDGTLLPFEQEDFIRIYFSELCKKLAPMGYEPQHTVKSVWGGTKAMIMNDGSRLNSEAFWETFNAMNPGLPDARRTCDEFYTHEFEKAKASLKYIPDHKPMIERLKAAGLRVVLATNPIFPLDGVRTRMAWVNLAPEDFELVTWYDTSTYCKPNLKYYQEILGKTGAVPEECIMVGNSVSEDMVSEKLGVKVFLANEFVENPDKQDYSGYPQGSIADAERFIMENL